MRTPLTPLLVTLGLSLSVAATSFAGPSCGAKHAEVARTAEADIVDTAIAAGSFQTLVTAVQAAGLVETLKGEGPFTVFAPTDAAFAALPAGALEGLLADPDALLSVLTYHVLPNQLSALDIEDRRRAKTVQGQRVRFGSDQHGLTIDGAKIVTADIHTSNGVIHVIDAVILPAQRTGL